MAALGGAYQDTLSTLRLRIQVHGDMRHLQQPDIANRIRALLLAGIRSASPAVATGGASESRPATGPQSGWRGPAGGYGRPLDYQPLKELTGGCILSLLVSALK